MIYLMPIRKIMRLICLAAFCLILMNVIWWLGQEQKCEQKVERNWGNKKKLLPERGKKLGKLLEMGKFEMGLAEPDEMDKEGWGPGKKFKIRFKNKRLQYRLVSGQPCPSETKILMLTMTRRYGFENRKVLRETWMNDLSSNETIRFVISDASNGENKTLEKQLDEEEATHGDLIIFDGLNDTYYDLHLKMYAAMQWQQAYCANTEWVLKVDDDVIVHLRRLEYWIEHKFRPILAQSPLTIFGCLLHGKVIRDKESKWYVSESVYPKDRYPCYTSGTAYLTTSETISEILLYAPMFEEFHLEDVLYTGMVADLANVARSDHCQHFLSFDAKMDWQQYNCEDGMPRAITFWDTDSYEQFREFYKQMQSIKC